MWKNWQQKLPLWISLGRPKNNPDSLPLWLAKTPTSFVHEKGRNMLGNPRRLQNIHFVNSCGGGLLPRNTQEKPAICRNLGCTHWFPFGHGPICFSSHNPRKTRSTSSKSERFNYNHAILFRFTSRGTWTSLDLLTVKSLWVNPTVAPNVGQTKIFEFKKEGTGALTICIGANPVSLRCHFEVLASKIFPFMHFEFYSNKSSVPRQSIRGPRRVMSMFQMFQFNLRLYGPLRCWMRPHWSGELSPPPLIT